MKLATEIWKEKGYVLKGKAIIDKVGNKFFPKKSKSTIKSVRYFCLECMGWDRRKGYNQENPWLEVKKCSDDFCPLFDLRFGRNPHSRKKGNPNILKIGKARQVIRREKNENGLKHPKRGKGMGNGKNGVILE